VIVVKNIEEPKKTVAKPRGRPPAFDRETVLASARETFWEHGYEGASIADLTAAMGITPQSLYAAFRSKAGLYKESLDQYRRMPKPLVGDPLQEDVDTVTAFDGRRATLKSGGVLEAEFVVVGVGVVADPVEPAGRQRTRSPSRPTRRTPTRRTTRDPLSPTCLSKTTPGSPASAPLTSKWPAPRRGSTAAKATRRPPMMP